MYLKLCWAYASSLSESDHASRDDLVKALAILEELTSTLQRVFGPAHPFTKDTRKDLQNVQKKLASV